MVGKSCHLHSITLGFCNLIGIREPNSMVPSCTVMPYIQTRATTEISMSEDVMHSIYQWLFVCMLFVLGSDFVHLEHGRFYSSHGTSGNRIDFLWVLGDIVIFQDRLSQLMLSQGLQAEKKLISNTGKYTASTNNWDSEWLGSSHCLFYLSLTKCLHPVFKIQLFAKEWPKFYIRNDVTVNLTIV